MIVSALSHIHETGFAYRDLKAENVVIDGDGKHCCQNDGSGFEVCVRVWEGKGRERKEKEGEEKKK